MTILLGTDERTIEAVFIPLGVPQAHDSSGRADQSYWKPDKASPSEFVVSTGA
jgi:hypothetical protein